MHLICYLESYNILQFVIGAYPSIDLNIQDSNGYTPLMLAIQKEDLNQIEKLLNYGAAHTSHNQYDSGDTPLHYASYIGNLNVVLLLVDYGAEIDQLNSKKMTPLMYSIQKGHLKLAKKLIDLKADPTIKDLYGDSALHWAIKSGVSRDFINDMIVGKDLTQLLYDQNEEGLSLNQL